MNGLALTFVNELIPENLKLKFCAAKCHLENELFDERLPGFISKHGEWIPRGEYLGLSSQNARRNLSFYSSGFDKQEFLNEYRNYSRFSIFELEEEVERLRILINDKI